MDYFVLAQAHGLFTLKRPAHSIGEVSRQALIGWPLRIDCTTFNRSLIQWVNSKDIC